MPLPTLRIFRMGVSWHHATSPFCATRSKVALEVNEAARHSVMQQFSRCGPPLFYRSTTSHRTNHTNGPCSKSIAAKTMTEQKDNRSRQVRCSSSRSLSRACLSCPGKAVPVFRICTNVHGTRGASSSSSSWQEAGNGLHRLLHNTSFTTFPW